MNASPFVETLKDFGAQFELPVRASGRVLFNNGSEISDPPRAAISFGDEMAEYKALTDGAGLADFSRRTQVALARADRAAFLHNLCTNQIRNLQPGAGCEAFLTNPQGHVLAHLHVFCQADRLVLETVPDQESKILAQLDRYLIREQVELLGLTEAWAELLLAGAEAASLLESLGCAPPQALLEHCGAQIGAVAAELRRVDITLGGGYLIGCERERLADLWRQLCSAGASPCGAAAVEMARVEAGSPYYGPDVTEKNLPQEIARDARAISFVKGCYIGQETVARIDALGHVNRTLVGVRYSGDAIPAAGAELMADGKTVGQVTSAAYSPVLGAPLALAYVRRGANAVGTPLQSDICPAEVVSLPLSR